MTRHPSVRDADLARDGAAILAVNNATVPAMNTLSHADLAALARLGAVRVAARGKAGPILGVVVVIGPGQPYDSLNYRWFSERYDDFLYIDRVAVAEAARGTGIGRLLYEDTFARARAEGRPRVLAEVNVAPPNPGSVAFHTRLGFEAVAERYNERDDKTVAMLVRPL